MMACGVGLGPPSGALTWRLMAARSVPGEITGERPWDGPLAGPRDGDLDVLAAGAQAVSLASKKGRRNLGAARRKRRSPLVEQR